MKIEDIEKLVKLLDKSSLTRLTYETEGEVLKLSKQKEVPAPAPAPAPVPQFPVFPSAFPGMPGPVQQAPAAMPAAGVPAQDAPVPAAAPAPAAADSSVTEVKSTFVGTISLNDEKSGKPYITVGAKVKEGQCICQIEAMKMYNSVTAPVSGEVLSIDVENGAIVEFGTVIARIREE